MKTSSLVLILSFCLSAIASGGDFEPSTKNSKKISKYCFKGDIKNLEKMKINGYMPAVHGYGNENNQTAEEVLDNQRGLSSSILEGMLEPGYIDVAPLKKCYDWMLENNGVIPHDYIYEEISDPAISVFNVGIIAKLISDSLSQENFQTLATDWAVIFARDYKYETNRVYEDSDGRKEICDFSIAISSGYSLKNIKRLASSGYAKNSTCLNSAITVASIRGYTEILNYLNSL